MMSESIGLLSAEDRAVGRRRIYIGIAIGIGLLVVVAIAVSLSVGLNSSGNDDASVNDDGNNPPNTNTLVCPATSFPISYDPFYKNHNTFVRAGPSVLIQNGTIWQATGAPILYGYDLFMQDGKIVQIGKNLAVNASLVYNVQGKYVTPGLVDTHSHLGDYSYPEDAWATQDGNELTDPTTPQLRAVDAINPNDPAIPLIRSGGVTSSLVLPGSGNVQGGQAAYVKLRGNTVSDMLMSNAPRALKMACGENPKRVYGSRDQMPSSRMGTAWLFRNQFYNAAKLKQSQQQWDCLNKAGQTTEPRPEDISLEPLVAVLNNQARLMVHCYKVEDLEMMIRTSKEFGFQISTFQHALEAYKIPSVMKDNNITVATFADSWGFKMEAFDASVWAPKILNEAGVPVAMKSDHPVLFAKHLVFEAAKAHHYGLPEEAALQSVTIIPANGMGIANRVGTLEIGKDADVVVWDRYPLQLGAQADKVFIDGEIIDDFELPSVPKNPIPQATFNCTSSTSDLYIVRGATVYTMDSQNSIISNATIVVTAGIITCLQAGDGCPVSGTNVYTVNGGIVIPGMLNVGSSIGLTEVDAESRSSDGTASVTNAADIRASDGITFNSFMPKHMYTVWAGGVTSLVQSPLGYNLISGVSVAFHTHGIVLDDALIKDVISLDINVGNDAKGSGYTGSISGQIAQLRSLFKSSNGTGNNLDLALQGKIPVVAHVDQADQIATLIRLKNELGFKLVIYGGAEAHLVANLLASADVPVIFVRVQPSKFETWKIVPNAVSVLYNENVTVGISIFDGSFVRNLRWEAGIAYNEGLPYQQALAAITKVPAKIYGLDQQGVGSVLENFPANFVVFNGDPLSLESDVQMVALNSYFQCQPRQL